MKIEEARTGGMDRDMAADAVRVGAVPENAILGAEA